ncbi:AMP-binding protein [Yeosuana marina]|uniref:AMP-binding protein n=1 Tax=Yeosuana marina TaxID=1565536 RepID=UPI0030C87EF9
MEAHSTVNQTIVSLFEKQVKDNPEATALVFQDVKISYNELNQKANQIAHFLIENLAIQNEEKIGLLLDRNLHTIPVIIGIAKAGATYVPIDPNIPEKRIKFIIQDAQIKTLITEKQFIQMVNNLQWEIDNLNNYLCVDSLNVHSEHETKENLLMSQELWDHVGARAHDQVTAGGWLSSYTREPFTQLEMEEYADNVYQKLLPYLNKNIRVLEIGCSSGFTLEKVAPKVGHYLGTDLSEVILNKTQLLIDHLEFDNVTLKRLAAHELFQLDEFDFDIIIMNGVIQLFHGHNYLRNVLKECVRILKNKGQIFIGGVMDIHKKDALLKDLQAFNERHSNEGFNTKLDQSSEVFYSSEFFEDLVTDQHGIRNVQISNQIHTIENELTKFRYDVVLHIDKKSKEKIKRKKHKEQYDYSVFNGLPAHNPEINISPEHLLYVVYVSGTEGHPQGVMVEHKNVVQHFLKDICPFDFNQKDIWSMYHSYTLDVSVWEMYGALLNGGKLIIVPEKIAQDNIKFNLLIEKEGVSILNLTSSTFKYLLQDDTKNKTLRYIMFFGEMLQLENLKPWNQKYPNCKLIRMYGSIETTIYNIFTQITPSNFQQRLSIMGKPIPYTTCVVLDQNKQLLPIGVIGELYLGGKSLARGYTNKKPTTSHRFIPNPFKKGERLYRSGLKVRILPNGDIEHLGQYDNHVNINGYHVELSEIGQQLLQHSAIKEAVIMFRKNTSGKKYLIAYLVFFQNQKNNLMKQYLSNYLPDYMIPSYYLDLESLPLKRNGMLDKKCLPAPDGIEFKNTDSIILTENKKEKILV